MMKKKYDYDLITIGAGSGGVASNAATRWAAGRAGPWAAARMAELAISKRTASPPRGFWIVFIDYLSWIY